ncbi:hypothetical protein [Salinarchaeum sp. Harcht-Bsk1]|uniref:hypothetical protein n=1 Tax=Salinarchaeum sp. Harcht-Bsk1 TaxID=1333523 RepID=UPI001181A3DB|nr:hypothetical protein [Salinarchaeum sp. Harcht-Bsk1]
MSSDGDRSERGGWGAVFVASMLCLAVALGIVVARAAAVPIVGETIRWPTLFAIPLVGGLVAGARFPGNRSSAVGSALLGAVWLGAIAFHVGLVSLFESPIVSPASSWLIFTVAWTPFAIVFACIGGLLGSGLAARWIGRSEDVDADALVDGGETVPLGRIARATLEGVGVMVAVAVAGVFVGPLAVIFGAPFAGGFVAGGRAPGGTLVGVFTGLLAGVLYVVTLAVAFVLWLRSLTWVGYGIGFVIVFYFLALLLTLVLSGLGGLFGALANDSSEDADAQEGAAESATEP